MVLIGSLLTILLVPSFCHDNKQLCTPLRDEANISSALSYELNFAALPRRARVFVCGVRSIPELTFREGLDALVLVSSSPCFNVRLARAMNGEND